MACEQAPLSGAGGSALKGFPPPLSLDNFGGSATVPHGGTEAETALFGMPTCSRQGTLNPGGFRAQEA